MQASTQIYLTKKEKLFIKIHPNIVLGTDSGWAPYVIKNDNGAISGYDANVLKLINTISGANFTLKLGKFGDMTKEAEKRSIDGLSTAIVTENFKKHFLFTKPYISLEKIVFTAKNNSSDIDSLDDLKGKKFGVNTNNTMSIAFAKKIAGIKIVYFNSTKELIEGVTTGKADAMLGNAAMFYLLDNMGNPFLKPSIFIHDNPLNLVFVIRNDFPEAVSIINKSLKIIGQKKLIKLRSKWFKTSYKLENKNSLNFLEIEKKYLKNKKQITMCIDPNWMPFEKLEDGKYIGISAEYFKLFQKNIPIPFKLIKTDSWEQSLEFAKERKCDILTLAMKTKSRKKYMNFTTPYFSTPLVMASRPDVQFISDIKQIKGKKIGIVKDYAFNEILRKKFPDIKIVDVKNIKDGLQQVVDKKLFGFIGSLGAIGYLFQTKFTGELKISGKFNKNWELGIAVRNDDPMLLNILNKAVNNISQQKKQKIINKYIGIKYERGFDYTLFWQIFGFIFLLAVILLYRYSIMKKYNKKMKKYLKMIDNNVLLSSSDKEGVITEVSEALCNLTGYKKEELIGKNHNIFRHKDMPKSAFKDLWDTIKSGKTWNGEVKNKNKDGSFYWADVTINLDYNANGSLKGYTAIRQNITDKKMFERTSTTDTLTQIPNRLHLNTIGKIELEKAKRYKSIFSTTIMDIDHFKNVNDTYGHDAGDIVLVEIAKILKDNTRDTDTIGRWGGEEFLIICSNTDANHTKIYVQKIKEKINSFDFTAVGHLTCSFGISEYNPDDKAGESFKRADEALYKAKNSGRNKIEIIN